MANFRLTDSQKFKAGLVPRKDKRDRKLNGMGGKRKRIQVKYWPKDEEDPYQDYIT